MRLFEYSKNPLFSWYVAVPSVLKDGQRLLWSKGSFKLWSNVRRQRNIKSRYLFSRCKYICQIIYVTNKMLFTQNMSVFMQCGLGMMRRTRESASTP